MDSNQEYKYLNYTYKLENGKHSVTRDNDEPNSLFKYYSVDDYKLDAVINRYFYATHPYSFNDSIDSSELLVDYSNISKEIYKSFYKRVLTNDEFLKYNFDECYELDKLHSFTGIRSFIYSHFSKQLGLISLTTQPLNILMWSHYATESGFVIELDKEMLLENIKTLNPDLTNHCLRPVQYVEVLESIDMFKEEFKTLDIPFFLYMTTVKRMEWQYEDEWRLSVYKNDMGLPLAFLSPGNIDHKGKNDRKLFYPKESLKSIILGKYFFNGNNCHKINQDLSFELKSSLFLDFVNYIYENFNNVLYMSGELERDAKFNRSVERIELKKMSCNTFKIVQKNEGFYKR